MKLYIANGTYVGTQADARAITKQFTEVDVPTDKAGLIGYLNSLEHAVFTDQYETIVTRQDPPVDSVDFDLSAAFNAAAIADRVALAEQLLHELAANAIIEKLEWIEKPDPRKDAEARQSFAQWEANKADDDEDTDVAPEEDPFA